MRAIAFTGITALLLISAACTSESQQKEEEVAAPSPERTQPVSDEQVLNVYAEPDDRIRIDTREVDQPTLLSEVEAAITMAKSGAAGNVTINLHAQDGADYVFYRKIRGKLLLVVNRERETLSQERWSVSQMQLSTEQVRELDGEVVVRLGE